MIRARDPQIASLFFNLLSYAKSYQKEYKLHLSIKSNFHYLSRNEVRQTMEVSYSSLNCLNIFHIDCFSGFE